jgi:hypothetical protein
VGQPAVDIAGTAPDGAPATAAVSVDWAGHLFFLTSSCYGCRAVWDSLAHREVAGAVVVVTPSPSTESASEVAKLAPGGVRVVMSSEGWHAYGVTGAPWVVEIADGVVVGDGPVGG